MNTPHDSSSTLVSLRGVGRVFDAGGLPVHALAGVDLDIGEGGFVVVHGRSGSGKTTLLNIIGGLDRADDGHVRVCDRDLVAASDAELGELRRGDVSFIFQGFGLLEDLTAAENVEVPLRLLDVPAAERTTRVAEMLDRVGLTSRAMHRPAELSGGEQQRVGIARALAGRPRLLIADEPTGQLDSKTGASITALLHELVADGQLTALVATHDVEMIADADDRIELSDGRIVDRTSAPRWSRSDR